MPGAGRTGSLPGAEPGGGPAPALAAAGTGTRVVPACSRLPGHAPQLRAGQTPGPAETAANGCKSAQKKSLYGENPRNAQMQSTVGHSLGFAGEVSRGRGG